MYVYFGSIVNKRSKTFDVGSEFGLETTGCGGLKIVNNWLIRITRGLISSANDDHVENNLKKSLVYFTLGQM